MSKKILAAVLLAAIPAFAQAATSASIDPQSAAVLQAVRSAMFQRPLSSVTSFQVTGSFAAGGITTKYQEWDDLAGLRFATAQVGGPFSGRNGWDGRVAWFVDSSGLEHADGGASTRLQSIAQAYLDNLAFLAPDAHGAAISYGGQKSEGGRTYDVLKVTPPGGTEFDLWVDTSTHLVSKEIGTIGNVTATTTLSDYRKSDGITFPFAQTIATSDGNSQTVALATLDVNQNVSAQFAEPASDMHDTSISGGNATTVPIQVINNHVYVQTKVDGKGPFTFILDTGGQLILTPEVVAALNAKSAGGLQVAGAGSDTETVGFTHIDTLQIGNATIRDKDPAVLPIGRGFGLAEGVHIDGMVGYETVARFLTTIDYANSTLTLATLPAAPATAPNASAIPFYFDTTIPNVPVTLDGVRTDAMLDTGARSSITLSSPFVAAHPSLAADEATADGVDGFGVGGPSFGKLGRIGTLQLGPFALARPTVTFGTQTQGILANPLVTANLGGDIWKRFTVTFDYPHYRVLLAPNASFATPFAYDRSGLFLLDKNDSYVVLDARPGTPAAKAGLKKGDVIVSVDGAPASNRTLAQLRTMLMGAPGTIVKLHVKNATGERDVALTLRDYV